MGDIDSFSFPFLYFLLPQPSKTTWVVFTVPVMKTTENPGKRDETGEMAGKGKHERLTLTFQGPWMQMWGKKGDAVGLTLPLSPMHWT